jgi:hypothetical protein
VIPWIEGALLALFLLLPAVLDDFWILFATRVFILGLLALSFDLVWAYAGILSFGQALFFGVAGYSCALLATKLNITSILVLLPMAAISDTRLRTRSAAMSGNRSSSSFAQRDSIATFWPSTKPTAFRLSRNAATRWAHGAAEALLMKPITGIAGCCALAASGHAAAPPSPAMNSRRLV